jgi:hypothetical protein
MSALVSIQVPRPYLVGEGQYGVVVTVEGVREWDVWRWEVSWCSSNWEIDACGTLGTYNDLAAALRVAEEFARGVARKEGLFCERVLA